eukprot:Hpha_TRINITY_DN13657_c0_g1::TRINITY_DN13657_c0_g1_i1::g.122549::m.122549
MVRERERDARPPPAPAAPVLLLYPEFEVRVQEVGVPDDDEYTVNPQPGNMLSGAERVFRISLSANMQELHEAVQAACAWEDRHMFGFHQATGPAGTLLDLRRKVCRQGGADETPWSPRTRKASPPRGSCPFCAYLKC